MQEPVLVEEAVKDASIDLLLFDHLRFLEALECHDELLDPLVDLMRFSAENVLEILIGGFVDLLSALGRSYLAWEQDRVLSYEVLNLVLDLLSELDQHLLSLV